MPSKYTSPIRVSVDAQLLALAQRQADAQMTKLAPLLRAELAKYLLAPYSVPGGSARQAKGGGYAPLQFSTTVEQHKELQAVCKALDVSMTNVLTKMLINIVAG